MRKIIYGMLSEFPNQEVKVSICSGAVMAKSCYHHGDLSGTIVNMAQSFPGSNNVPFLDDIGQFGSRISPVASATRYIFTKLNENFRKLFLKDDDGILVHQDDDGMKIEPEYYLPVIPTVLLNGSDGMGTGFACRILNYNPLHLISACEEMIKKGDIKNDLTPWYRGFAGTIEKVSGQTIFTGRYEIVNTTTLRIDELPIGSFTQKYREVLNDLEDRGIVKTYTDNSSEQKTEFIVKCPREVLTKSHEELLKTFKLISRETENFTVWTQNGKLRKFESSKDLIQWFVNFRLMKYEERRQSLIGTNKETLELLNEKSRFIKFYLENSKKISTMKKVDIVSLLQENKFVNIDDLLGIKVYNLTGDQIQEVQDKIQKVEETIKQLQTTTNKEMYLNDLSQAKTFFKSRKTF